MTKNIFSALQECSSGSNFLIKNDDFLTPSYIVTIAAHLKKNPITLDCFQVQSESIQSYLATIGFNEALWNIPCINYRHNIGSTYSVLTLLDNEEATDSANTQIISCISNFTTNYQSEGLNSLKEVIGEVHDNVWSHGKSTGFSMTQLYKKAGKIEFALADLGGGFLKELNRVNLPISTHDQAIKWCIEKGHSSKKIEAENYDDWTQQLPSDVIGNPMGKSAKYRKSNNHAGLGLAKLIELIQQYNGKLNIVSGNCMLSINPNSPNIVYTTSEQYNWDGVIITCQLNVEALTQPCIDSVDNSELSDILLALTD